MPPDDYGDQYALRTLERRLLSLREPAMRRAQLRRHLLGVDAPTVASHLQPILERAALGESDAEEMVLALITFVETAEAEETLALEALHLHARTHEMTSLAWFLLDPPAARVAPERNSGKPPWKSLGERRAMAAGWDPRYLERLLVDDDPMVIERLCANPRIQLQHIQTMLTRRPCPEQVLRTVVRFPAWFNRREVRTSLASNPYTPTGLTLRILPTLSQTEHHRIRLAMDLHENVREATTWWLSLRSTG